MAWGGKVATDHNNTGNVQIALIRASFPWQRTDSSLVPPVCPGGRDKAVIQVRIDCAQGQEDSAQLPSGRQGRDGCQITKTARSSNSVGI